MLNSGRVRDCHVYFNFDFENVHRSILLQFFSKIVKVSVEQVAEEITLHRFTSVPGNSSASC